MGVLSGYRVIELAGMGPAPMCGMLLADMGAEVIRIDRGTKVDPMYVRDVSARGKKSVILNLKSEEGHQALMDLVATADVLLEGYRPGVTEKLGVGPEHCWAVNPRLVYGRMTGWGQTGPLAQAAGHDINYIAITGALHAVGRPGQKPAIPVNLIGDFGGGTMFLAMGVLAALLEAQKSGTGQVVDAAMVDGAANLMWMCHSFHAAGYWNADEKGANILDGGAHFYDTYEAKDGKYVAIGPIEPQFYTEMITRLGLDPAVWNHAEQNKPERWAADKETFAAIFKTRTRDEWCEILEGTDACFAPVLTFAEAPDHPHNVARNMYVEVDGFKQPGPAPRFSRTPSAVQHGQHALGEDTAVVLQSIGYSAEQIAAMRDKGAVI